MKRHGRRPVRWIAFVAPGANRRGLAARLPALLIHASAAQALLRCGRGQGRRQKGPLGSATGRSRRRFGRSRWCIAHCSFRRVELLAKVRVGVGEQVLRETLTRLIAPVHAPELVHVEIAGARATLEGRFAGLVIFPRYPKASFARSPMRRLLPRTRSVPRATAATARSRHEPAECAA